VHNIAEAYLRVAQDIRTGSHTCPTFADAVERHHLLDAIERSSRSGQRVTL
jgi:predicted dehydrogenase